MDSDNEAEPEVTFAFFKGISVNNKAYLCDFHKVVDKKGGLTYRIMLQSSGAADILVDIGMVDSGIWQILSSNTEVSAELQWQLITAILKEA